ncbi:hypothetical protein [Rhodococcus sp. ABRD24]|nr:hypothetical protein [Rhodococcus sp. ABRD24]
MLGKCSADRLDTELLLAAVDVVDDHLRWRSSFAEKKADADFRSSFAR